MLITILLIVALLLFVLGAVNSQVIIAKRNINLTAAGLAFWVLSILLS
jgi:hypothetical protein